METCIVTGGAGFIGSHLVDRLLDDYRVICIDNLSTGSVDNIRHNISRKNFVFVEHDVKKPVNIEGGVSRIFHLASRASPSDFPTHPIDILLTNSLGTYNMLNLAAEKGSTLVLASSSEVYGDPMRHPQREDYFGNVNILGVRGCYDEAKRFSEAMCMAFFREKGVDARMARIFNTYGPRMRAEDGRVIPNFITRAMRNEDLTVHGMGQQTRSFCYVSEMVDGLLRLMGAKNMAGKAINLGSTEEMPVMEVARLVKGILKSSSKIVFDDLPENDPLKRKPDTEAAKKYLGWAASVPLKEGLKRTIEYFREQGNSG